MSSHIIGSSIVMALLWVGLAVYILANYPETRSPFASGRIFFGWLAFILITAWNVMRAVLAHKRSKRERDHERTNA